MNLSDRLRQARSPLSRKEFADRLQVHPNTVANYENGRDPPVSYVLAVSQRAEVHLEWLINGEGPMRTSDDEPSLSHEQLTYAVARAITRHFGESYIATSLYDRAKVMRAVTRYLGQIGVTAEGLPDTEALVGMVKLTSHLLGIAPRVAKIPGDTRSVLN
jgi:transcriptional regulator with XRE-family HTH domain